MVGLLFSKITEVVIANINADGFTIWCLVSMPIENNSAQNDICTHDRSIMNLSQCFGDWVNYTQ